MFRGREEKGGGGKKRKEIENSMSDEKSRGIG
jgi:hypothetical protein